MKHPIVKFSGSVADINQSLQFWNCGAIDYEAQPGLLLSTVQTDLEMLAIELIPKRIRKGFFAYVGKGRVLGLDNMAINRAFLRALQHSQLLPTELMHEVRSGRFSEHAISQLDMDRYDLFKSTLRELTQDLQPAPAPVDAIRTFSVRYAKGPSLLAYMEDPDRRMVVIENNKDTFITDLAPGQTVQGILQDMEHHLEHGVKGERHNQLGFPEVIDFLDGLDPQKTRRPRSRRRKSDDTDHEIVIERR